MPSEVSPFSRLSRKIFILIPLGTIFGTDTSFRMGRGARGEALGDGSILVAHFHSSSAFRRKNTDVCEGNRLNLLSQIICPHAVVL